MITLAFGYAQALGDSSGAFFMPNYQKGNKQTSMELMKRQDTAMWQVIDDTPQQTLPMQQPVTNITYNVQISGVAGWLTVLAQMPAATVWAGAAVVGVLGAVAVSALMLVATVAMQMVFGLTVAAVVAVVALFLIAALKG